MLDDDQPDALERAILELEDDYVACSNCGGRGYTGAYYGESGALYVSCSACTHKRGEKTE